MLSKTEDFPELYKTTIIQSKQFRKQSKNAKLTSNTNKIP